MQLRIALEECDDVEDWSSEYAEFTHVHTATADFCRYHGLSVTGTQLKHERGPLLPGQVLHKVHSASTAPSGLRLSATFNITAAFHVWLSLGQAQIHDQSALGREWYPSVLAVARSKLATSADIAQMLRLRGSEQMAPTPLQFAGCCPVCRYYGHNSRYCFSSLKQNRGECLFLSTIEHLRADMAVHTQSASTSAAASRVQYPAIEPASVPHLTYTHALRACVITLKLISLTSSVTSMVDVSMALWHTLDTIGRQFSKRSALVNGDSEECQMSQQLTQLLVLIMRKNLTLDGSVWQNAVCCSLLSGCMHQLQQPIVCQAVACKLAETGGLLALAEGIAQGRPQALFACHAIFSMMNCQLPEHQIANIEDQLLSARAVRHLSGLLCPEFDHEQVSKPQQRALHGQTFLSWARSAYEPDFITAAPQKSQSRVMNIAFVISVMAKLVDRQKRQQGKPKQAAPHCTLSQTSRERAAAAVSHVLEHGLPPTVLSVSQIRALGAHILGQLSDRDVDSEDQLSGSLPCWPTPSVNVWGDIQTTVVRAFLSLEWLLRQGPLKEDASHAHDSDAQCLMHDIAALIYRLVAGHVLDDKLNMQRVFTSGVLPILEAWSIYGVKSLDLGLLGQLLLTRMTTDAALRSCDMKLDASGKLREVCAVQQMAKMFGSEGALLLQPVAPIALGALYAALSDKDQCKRLATKGLLTTGFLQCLHQLKDDKAACFTLCACWACLASVHLQGATREIKACSIYQPRVLKAILSYVCSTSLEETSLPWPSECCLGLVRVLMKLSELCAHVPEEHITLQMHADCMHLALGLMRQWRSITTSNDLAILVLLASFLALDQFGGVKLIKHKSLFCDKFKDYAVVLTDVLGDLMSGPAILADTDKHVTGYSYSDLQSALAELPHSLLQDIMHIPVAHNCWLYFGEKIFPDCVHVLMSMAKSFMRKAEGTLTACPQLEAFVHMLAEHERMQPSPAPADYKLLREGAVAALQFLYLEVRCLVYASEANKRPIVAKIERLTMWLESMRVQDHWVPVWAQLNPQDWCSEFKQANALLASSLQDLKQKCNGLSARSVKRIQHCFALGQLRAQAGEAFAVTAVPPAEVFSEEEQAQADQEQAAWAAAEAAAAELMAEEDQAQAKQQQAAVKAAAKKAKKQQQRARNQLQLLQDTSSDQPKTPKAASATAAFDTSGLLHNALDNRTDLIQAMHPVAAQHKEGGLGQTQTVVGAMQQQQGPFKRLPKTGTRDSQTNSAS